MSINSVLVALRESVQHLEGITSELLNNVPAEAEDTRSKAIRECVTKLQGGFCGLTNLTNYVSDVLEGKAAPVEVQSASNSTPTDQRRSSDLSTESRLKPISDVLSISSRQKSGNSPPLPVFIESSSSEKMDTSVAMWLNNTYSSQKERVATDDKDFTISFSRQESMFVVDDPSEVAEDLASMSPRTTKRTTYKRTVHRKYQAAIQRNLRQKQLRRLKVPSLQVSSPEFDIFEAFNEYKENTLMVVAMNVFLAYSFVKALEINVNKLKNFVERVQELYRAQNPYHNAVHAADVLQTTHVYLATNEVRDNFTDVELMSVLVAALVHDVGHLGISNTFLVKSRHPLAVLYNDNSPLESMHAALAFSLLEDPECNFLDSPVVTSSHHEDFRSLVIDVVNATDMKNHQEMIETVRDILEDGEVDDNEVVQLFKGIVHAADLSNPMKPTHIYENWATRVIAEFWQQGDQESRLNMPISMMCDRNTATIAQSQVGFITYVVKPFMTELESVLPPVWMARLETNLEHMKALADDAHLTSRIVELADNQWTDAPRTVGPVATLVTRVMKDFIVAPRKHDFCLAKAMEAMSSEALAIVGKSAVARDMKCAKECACRWLSRAVLLSEEFPELEMLPDPELTRNAAANRDHALATCLNLAVPQQPPRSTETEDDEMPGAVWHRVFCNMTRVWLAAFDVPVPAAPPVVKSPVFGAWHAAKSPEPGSVYRNFALGRPANSSPLLAIRHSSVPLKRTTESPQQ